MDPVGLLHPRKLEHMLRACPTAELRARAALEFVRGTASSPAGFLFYVRNGDLVLAAATGDRPPPPDMHDAARVAMAELRDSFGDDRSTRDVGELLASSPPPPSPAWRARTGESYQSRVLSTRGFSFVSVVFLRLGEKPLAPLRHAHIAAICSALVDSGDCTPLA